MPREENKARDGYGPTPDPQGIGGASRVTFPESFVLNFLWAALYVTVTREPDDARRYYEAIGTCRPCRFSTPHLDTGAEAQWT